MEKKPTLPEAIDKLNKMIHNTEVFLEVLPWDDKAEEAATKLGEMRAMRDHFQIRLANSSTASRSSPEGPA